MTQKDTLLTRRGAFAIAAPMVISHAVQPLAGVVDTAVISATGDTASVAGMGLGVTLFSLFTMTVYFLRMGTTALSAQAAGAGALAEGQRVLLRGLLLAGCLSIVLLALQTPILQLGFVMFNAGEAAESTGSAYVLTRLWGAPALFASLAFTGWLIGRGLTRAVMVAVFVFSAINIFLDLLFVLHFNWGVVGVGAATAIAEWLSLTVLMLACWRTIRRDGGILPETLSSDQLTQFAPWRRLLGVSRDLLLRTWALFAGFAWFMRTAAGQGEAVLAGSHVLVQIITLWAFVLDAFAFTAESAVGQAFGARSRAAFHRAVRVTAELSLAAGAVFMMATFLGGPAALEFFVADAATLETAMQYLPYCALVPFLGAAAWLLDGVFVGAAQGPTMRNAMIAAAVAYIGLDRVLTPNFGADGMWIAFIGFYVIRALCLGVAYPRLTHRIGL